MDGLGAFLRSAGAPGQALCLEGLDGFLSALAASPAPAPPAAYLPQVWDPAGPAGRSPRAAAVVARRLASISWRLSAGLPHAPLLTPGGHGGLGRAWAEGFLLGVALGGDLWEPVLADEAAAGVLVAATALAAGADGEPGPDEAGRMALLAHLPGLLGEAHAYWRRRARMARVRRLARRWPDPARPGYR